jgi:hypothetical protein
VWHWYGKSTEGKCEKLRAHNPKECKGTAAPSPGEKTKVESLDKKKKPGFAKKLRVAKAYKAKMEQQAAESASGNESDE